MRRQHATDQREGFIMRPIVAVTVFLLFFVLTLVYVREGGGRVPSPALAEAAGEDRDCDATGAGENRPYANRMDPRKYHATYEAVRRMPSERSSAGGGHRSPSGIAISDNAWESFGPMGTTAQNDQNSNR